MDQSSGGVLSILLYAVRAFTQQGSSEAAAGMTFYAIFSLFPLLALAVTITSLFVAEDKIVEFLVRFVTPVFPVSRMLIDQNIERFVSQRGAISIIGFIGLIWSASSTFALLVQNMNRAWENARRRNFFQNRMIGIYVIAAILVLLGLAWVSTTLLSLVYSLEPAFMQTWFTTTAAQIQFLSQLFSMIVSFLIFLLIYRYLPSTRVLFREAFWGALLVSVAWKLTSTLFAFYISSGLSRYDVLYGTISAVAVLMFWLYLNNILILLGAHLCASISRHNRLRTEMPAVVVSSDSEVAVPAGRPPNGNSKE